ncbi:MAG: DNA mismatch repair endonuclease MutL, partial [Armatimonadota bacterium]|nr:DNA mismatch repair endonuclease MutL [Armatimonadota bacterium]
MPIRRLPPTLVNKIAAGEVVERPASVVKELVENSLDAGASRIDVSVERGGLDLVRVADNGCGIPAEELELAVAPHATSKIRSAAQIAAVQTFGFRGEALASIAAVSELELVTRQRGAPAGVRLLAHGGIITDLLETGAPEGTAVTVRALFFNAPVRRRYLRSPATELAHVADAVGRSLISHPEVAIRLSHGGESILHHNGNGSLADAVAAVFGPETARQMIPLEVTGAPFAATGLLAPPSLTRGTRAWQWLFVNGRPIRSKVLTHALEQGYHTLTPPGRFPVAVLLLRVDPGLVDVNVHPAKSEVRLLLESEAHRFVARAVRQTLEAADLTPRVEGAPAPPSLSGEAGLEPSSPPPLPLEWDDPAEGVANHLPEARAQIHNTYILAEGPEGLFIVDQHTAHERSLFEQFMSGAESEVCRPLALTVPFVLSLAPREAAALRENRDALVSVGFTLEPFGNHAFLVRTVPAALAGSPVEGVLRDTIEELLQEPGPRTLEARRERLAALMACRGAVKAGHRLTLQEMQAILRGLYALPSRFTCQHGRPTVILLSREELERRFQR